MRKTMTVLVLLGSLLCANASAQDQGITAEQAIAGFADAAFGRGDPALAMRFISPADEASREKLLRNAAHITAGPQDCPVETLNTFVRTNEQGTLQGYIEVIREPDSVCRTLRMRATMVLHEGNWYVAL